MQFYFAGFALLTFGNEFLAVVCKTQQFEIGEAAQFRWYLPAQPVPIKAHPDDAAVVIGNDAVPFADWLVAQPAIVIPAVCGMVEVIQGFSFGRLRNYLKTLSCHCRRYQIRAQASWIRPM